MAGQNIAADVPTEQWAQVVEDTGGRTSQYPSSTAQPLVPRKKTFPNASTASSEAPKLT